MVVKFPECIPPRPAGRGGLGGQWIREHLKQDPRYTESGFWPIRAAISSPNSIAVCSETFLSNRKRGALANFFARLPGRLWRGLPPLVSAPRVDEANFDDCKVRKAMKAMKEIQG